MASKKPKKNRAKAQGKRKRKATPKKKAQKTRSAPKKKDLKKRIPGRGSSADVVAYETRGLGANSAGQSGDTQGLPEVPVGDAESVEELLEEGQTYEAEVLDGVENARDADKSEVKTREVPVDDVPEEYRGKD
ncbi:MAG TPA: hypothetical protein VKA02_12065 [Candidatus Acidoferrum sp.]|nr:hypothetical protein [Candidatus Acidoferrum sp.]